MGLVPGNEEKINVPVGATFAVNPKLMVGAQTGISGYLDGFGDAYFIPLTLGGMYMVSDTLGAGAFFSFDNIAGNNSSADFRSLQLAVHYMVPGS